MNLINRYRQIKFALATNHAACEQTNSRALVLIAGLAVASLLLTPGLAMATPWDGAAASVLAIFTGGLARTIAIIAVIACGIAAIAATGDREKALAAIPKMTATCIACHYSYRIR